MAAVDRTARAERVIGEAVALAQATGRESLVVHVLTRSDFVDLKRTDADRTDESISEDQIRNTGADIAEDQARPIADDFRLVGLVGKPAERIIEHAEDGKASFIVTSGRKRSPIGKVLFGSVTQSIILNADLPRTYRDERGLKSTFAALRGLSFSPY